MYVTNFFSTLNYFELKTIQIFKGLMKMRDLVQAIRNQIELSGTNFQ